MTTADEMRNAGLRLTGHPRAGFTVEKCASTYDPERIGHGPCDCGYEADQGSEERGRTVLVSYCVSEEGHVISCQGDERVEQIEIEERRGGFLLLTREFPASSTAEERIAFYRGLKEGRAATLAHVRTALGMTR